MTLVTDPEDPRLKVQPERGQNEAYLVLSETELARGYTRPFRDSYHHNACHTETRMGYLLAATYARDPKFYGATYCVQCQGHFPVSEFTWSKDGLPVGS